jgi:integrase/recombinase XerD
MRKKMAREGKAKVLSEAEFKLLLLVAKEGQFGVRNVALVYCSFGLGLRAKEMASLTIADVANVHYHLLDVLCLKRAMTKGEQQRHAYLTHKKIREALQAHLNDLNDMPRTKALYQTQRKSRFSANTLQQWFKALYDKAGIHGASSHSGRRTFITRLIEQGADIKAVSRLAGHANIVTTAIYVEDNPERLKRIANLALF